MSAARQLAVYDGQRHIGTVFERGDRTCIAKDISGRKIGTFANMQKAADALTEVDKVFNAGSRELRSG